MKSETPRTDECIHPHSGTNWSRLMILSRQLERELNQWRECANKLADCNLKTVPLICLEPDERHALSTLENLNRAAAMPNEKS